LAEKGSGLLLVMMDIDPEHEEDFNRWYDEEHVPERKAIPGFLTARRYKSVEGGPKYLAIYEMDNPEVLDSEAYRYVSEEGRSEWTERVVGRAKNYVRNVYVEITAGE
jgi:antibiotic biosynthesis monooxygenase (ABM) superfamily enzyme